MEVSKINKYLALIFIFNCVFALCVGLTHDEAYYWIYSLSFKWGHYDHPPMVGWIIKLGTLLWGKNELGVRFFFNIMQIVSINELWKLSNKKNPELFIFIFLAFPLAFASGVLALPDTPLLFFSILFVKYFKNYIENDDLKTSMVLALVIALLFYSKYHGATVVLFSILAFPKVVLRKSFWLVFVISLGLFLPHILWQIDHDFVTFKYHLFKRKQKVLSLENIGHYLGSQMLIAGFLAFPIVLMSFLKKTKNVLEKILKFNVIGLYLLILVSALRNKIEANWTITSSGFLILLVYQYLSEDKPRLQKLYYKLALPSVAIFLLIFSAILVLPENLIPNTERLSEVRNWRQKASEIVSLSPSGKIVANTYQIGAKLNFYSGIKVPVLHYQVRKSDFLYLPNLPRYNKKEQVSFVTYNKSEKAKKIYIGFPDYVYVYPTTTIEEITRNESKD